MTHEDHESQWYMDTSASDHFTSDLGKLSNPCFNSSFDSMFVGNDEHVSILGYGRSTITCPSRTLHLHNILYLQTS